MTIASAITNAQNKIVNAYNSLGMKGAVLPNTKNLSNMPETVESMSSVYSNFEIYGSPSVNITTGVVSGFSNNSNYLKLPTVFDPAGLPWEVGMKFTTSNDTETKQVLFHSCPATDRYGIIFQISGASRDKLFQIDIGSSSSSWLWWASGTHIIQTNTTYWVKFGWSGTEYYLDYSFDGETYTRDISGTNSTPARTPLNRTYIGVYYYPSTGIIDHMQGSIDLSQSYAKINGEIVWSAASLTKTVPTKIDTSLFYLNDKMRVENGAIYANTNTGNSYINTDYNVLFTPAQWKKELIIQLHLKTPQSLSNQWIMSNGNEWNTGIGITLNSSINNAFWVALGQSDTSKAQFLSGTTIPQTSTEYWVRVYKPNTENESHNTVLQISTDGINWTTEDSLAIANIESNYTTLGTLRLFNLRTSDSAEYFHGGIYFEDTFISVGGEKVWYLADAQVPESTIPYTISYTNYDAIGTPTVNTQTGIATGFSLNPLAVLKTTRLIEYNPSSFERQICFTTGNDVTTTQFLTSDYNYQGIVFGINAGKFVWYASSNGSSWNIINGSTGTTNLSTNTKYWVRLVFDGSYYKCYLSTTGAFSGEETTEISISSTTKIYGSTYTYIGAQCLDTYYLPFLGSIDLSDTYIKVNGNNFWSAGMAF